jgi:hypothetical protein
MRAIHTAWCRATAPRISRFALRHSGIERSSVLRGVIDSSSITALFPLSPAHQKQGPFPPPALPGLHGLTALSDFRAGHHPSTTLKVRPSPNPDLPQLPRSPSPHAVLTTPVDRIGACRFLPYPRGLPRLTGGSASTTSLSRPTQASLALRPAGSLARPNGGLCPEASTRPVTRPSRSVATMSYRQLHGWILLPLVICAVGAHR